MYNEKKFLPFHIYQERKNMHASWRIRSIFVAINVHMEKPKKSSLKKALVPKFESWNSIFVFAW
jgi:hypothetical protein